MAVMLGFVVFHRVWLVTAFGCVFAGESIFGRKLFKRAVVFPLLLKLRSDDEGDASNLLDKMEDEL